MGFLMMIIGGINIEKNDKWEALIIILVKKKKKERTRRRGKKKTKEIGVIALST